MFTVKYLSDKEFDALPIRYAKGALGAADQKTQTAWVRRSKVPIRDAFIAEHELEELVQKFSPHEIDGIRYKGSKSVLGQVGDWIEKTFIPEGAKEFVTDKVPFVGDMMSRGWLGPVAQQFTQEGKEAYESGTGTSGIMNNWVYPILAGAAGGPLTGAAFGALNSPTGVGNMALGGAKGYGLGQLGQWGAQGIGNMINSVGAGPTSTTGPVNVLGGKSASTSLQQPSLYSKLSGAAGSPGGALNSSNFASDYGLGQTGLNAGSQATQSIWGKMGDFFKSTLGFGNASEGGGLAPNVGRTLLGLGIGGLGQLMPQGQQPQVPDLSTSQGVQDYKNVLTQGPTAVTVTPETKTRLLNEVQGAYDNTIKQVKDYYKNIRPDADYTNDSDYKRDVDRLNKELEEAKTQAIDTYQNQIYSQQLEGTKYFADMDVYELMAQTGLDAASAQNFQDWLRSVGGTLMQSGLGMGGFQTA